MGIPNPAVWMKPCGMRLQEGSLITFRARGGR